jgi:multiple sugar transport system permease protein
MLWSLWPKQFTLHNYSVIFSTTNFKGVMLNSIYIAALATAIVVVLGVLAAYSLVGYQFKKRENIAFFILSLYILPPIVTIIPVWKMAQRLALLDRGWFLSLVYAFFNLPLTVWLLRNFFQTVPKELEDAALVDGCSKLESLFRIMLPLTTPGIAVSAIFAFIFSWNEFLFAVVLTEVRSRTIPVEIAAQVSYFIEWGKLSGMTIISVLPVLILSFFVQKYIVVGLTLGGVKE